MDEWQTVLIPSIHDTTKMTRRLIVRGYNFRVTSQRPKRGYLLSFTTEIDFERDAKLFEGIDYKLVPNPTV